MYRHMCQAYVRTHVRHAYCIQVAEPEELADAALEKEAEELWAM